MQAGYFITGTDTNVGKTWVTVAMMEAIKARRKTVIGLKPVASGCDWVEGRWVNADALLLKAHASVALDYGLVNPYAYPAPVSPHIAGKANPVALNELMLHFLLVKDKTDFIVVEGAGGWYSPLNDHLQNAHLASALGLPVILVVAIRLGCINHALLTYRAIQAEGRVCAGWVAVCSDPAVLEKQAVIGTLSTLLDTGLLGVIPYLPSADFSKMAVELNLDCLGI